MKVRFLGMVALLAVVLVSVACGGGSSSPASSETPIPTPAIEGTATDSITLVAKDLKFVVDKAYDFKAPVPVAQTLLHLFELGVAQGWGDEDISAITRVLEQMNPKS